MGDAVFRGRFVARAVLHPDAQAGGTGIGHLAGENANAVVENSLVKHRREILRARREPNQDCLYLALASSSASLRLILILPCLSISRTFPIPSSPSLSTSVTRRTRSAQS